MSNVVEVKVPDIGGLDEVDIVEVLVAAGDRVEVDQSLISLESDKASMEVPSPHAGTVKEVKVQAGDKASEGTVILLLESAEASGKKEEPKPSADSQSTDAAKPAASTSTSSAAAAPPPSSPAVAAPSASTGSVREIEPAPRDIRDSADLHAEVLVLGSGPGGYSAAFRAADLGKKVVLVERYASLGGVCLNVGCIPSKALLHAAKVIDEAADFAHHGITFGKPKIDLDALRGWKDDVVGKLTGGITSMSKARKVTVVQGTGKLTSKHTLEVQHDGETQTISFDAAILATGSRVVRLPFLPDDPRVIDSTGALELADVPKRLLILGGGIIGLEMATVYHALGSKITVVELMDSLIPGCDKDLVRPLHKRIAERYENIYLQTKVTAVEAQKKGLKVTFEADGSKSDAPETDTFDKVLTAVGRRPNGDLLNAEAAGLEVTDRGFVPVDRQLRTNVPNIFAIGDLTGQPMLAHKAVHEGKTAAEVIAGHPAAFDARVIPSVAYTDPEVAWVGLTETEAKANGTQYEKASFPWAANGRSLALGRSEGSTKLLFDPDTNRLLGGGIVGPNAGDLIAEVALAIEMDCEAEDIGLTVHPHPTLSETVAMSAEAFAGTLTDLYLPKRKKK